jgi:pilus retraction protein PilT
MNQANGDDYLEALCEAAASNGASDMILHEGRVPRFRIGGRLVEMDAPVPGSAFFDVLWQKAGAEAAVTDSDAALVTDGGLRFRVNLLRALGRRGAVLRRVPMEIPALESLGVPSGVLKEWAAARSGIALVCGAAGSGKSTTLAALLDWMNTSMTRHVVTIEDPIEYAFVDSNCLFTQREVGIDTPTFAEGLRRSLRQNPDVILIGEIRDRETAATSLQAAETGHLVLATIHSATAAETVERMESLFPPDARESIRKILSAQLLGILGQKLLPANSGGQVVACEFFTNSGVIRKFIAAGRIPELADAVTSGNGFTAGGFLKALAGLVRSNRISEETAMAATNNPQELQKTLRGISSRLGGGPF